MKKILLHTRRPGLKKYAIVDDQDYKRLREFTWVYFITRDGNEYAKRQFPMKNYVPGKTMLMHREITKFKPGVLCDHKNGNGLDNRRINLRPCNEHQNGGNSRKTRSKTSSRYKGVTWFKRHQLWRGQIMKNRKQYHLGYFDSEVEAAIVYNVAAQLFFGKFARLNPV